MLRPALMRVTKTAPVLAVLALAALVILGAKAHAAADADQDAFRMYQNSFEPKAAFSGVLRITGRDVALEVEVRGLDGMSRYIFHSGGKTVDVLRGGGKIIVKVGPRNVSVEVPSFLDFTDTTDLIMRNYSASIAGRDIVGGRPARKIEMTPLRPGRPDRVVWIDEATGIQLRRDDYRYDGSLIERRELVKLNVVATPDKAEAERWRQALLDPDLDDSLAARLMAPKFHQFRPGPPLAQFFPSRVPEGYVLIGARLAGQPRGPVRHFVWTDGIGVISAFVREVPWWARRPQPVTVRPDGGVELESDGLRLLLVGDATPEELTDMAASFLRKR